MKKKLLSVCLGLLSAFAHGQNGLECVVVEKYYVSDANDTIANTDGGRLPVGSVTYRIYADLLPGYKFQAGYGVPGHELRMATTTSFFNNEDRGTTSPTFTKAQAARNTVMLDSWFSAGAACSGNFGIMKSLDNGFSTVLNSYVPAVLQNNNPDAGIPLSIQDGFISGTPEQVTFVGFTSTDLDVFDATSQSGNLLSTTNASWASLNGSIGPDPVDNKVLIAQMTTDGIFSFELNIQIGTPSGGFERYVAQNPVANEIQLPCLTYNSLTVGIPHTETAESFDVYPNPANDLITIECNSVNGKNSKAGYMIYDMEGKKVLENNALTITGKYSENVDLSSLESGVYVVEFLLDGVASHRKIIKY